MQCVTFNTSAESETGPEHFVSSVSVFPSFNITLNFFVGISNYNIGLNETKHVEY
jgi:hypothetical protein